MKNMTVALCMVSALAAAQASAEDVATGAASDKQSMPGDSAAAVPAAASAPPAAAAPELASPKALEAAPAGAQEAASPSDAALSARLATVEQQTQALDKARADAKTVLDKVSKLKVSGYIQGRYEWHQDATNGWNFNAKPTTTNPPGNAGSGTKTTFYVRRARLDTAYKGTNMEYVLQLDAGGDSVGLRDAEAAFVDTWTPAHLRVSVGQFKYPFGAEIPQSDTVREMPERSRMIQQLFAGERDRGLKVQGTYQWLRFQVALINGNGVQDPIFKGGKDENSWKDVVGRVGFDFTTLIGGVSGYYGANDVYNPSYNSTTNPITNPLDLKRYARTRVGADLQGLLDVPNLGNLSLRGEVIYSRDKNKAYNELPASSCQDRIGWGWSMTAAQNVGKHLGAVLRVDGYDPLLQGSLDKTACASNYTAATKDRIVTYGGGVLVYVSSDLKASFIYEHPTEQADKKVDNDLFTMQLQAKF
jgi:hypothetical protein